MPFGEIGSRLVGAREKIEKSVRADHALMVDEVELHVEISVSVRYAAR